MTLSSATFQQLWGGAFLVWFAMTYPYYSKWNNHSEDLAGDIRSFNARRGYDRSVLRNELAREIRVPFRDEKIHQFAENNGLDPTEYTQELQEHLGNSHWLFWAVCLHFLDFILILAGFTYFTPLGFVPAIVYLFVLYILLAISVLLYWYL